MIDEGVITSTGLIPQQGITKDLIEEQNAMSCEWFVEITDESAILLINKLIPLVQGVMV